MSEKHDLGDGFYYSFFQWSPDRKLNPQYAGKVDINPAGITIWRLTDRSPDQVVDDSAPEGKVWEGVAGCWFDSPAAREVVEPERPLWELHSLHPLHLEPSIQMHGNDGRASYHGFIREGKWVSA